LHGLITLQKKIEGESLKQVSWYRKGPSEAIPVPVLGPDLIDMRKVALIREKSQALPEAESAEVSDVESSSGENAAASEVSND
jgi:NADH-quinone oxidoreductase subunit B